MKILRLLFLITGVLTVFVACQKEIEFAADGPSVGTLKKDALGDCMPSAITGIYKENVSLTSDNFIDVNVDITTVGTYSIVTDTVNGFSFKGTGTFGVLGNNLVRLYGSGKPLLPGLSTFTVTYGGTTCSIDVTVLGTSTGPAVFTLGGAPGSCAGFAMGTGTYVAGQALVAANTVFTNINVTATGTYDLGTDTVNGIYFRAVGSFTTMGAQSLTLSGHGTPLAAGNFNYTVKNGSNTCTFSITVTSAGTGAATYTLGNSSGACTGTVIAGTYKQGQALTAGNTVKVDVNVTTPGTYNISTTTNNNVIFAASGTFAAAGAQTVTLTGSGTPAGSGLKTHVINGASNTCSFDITYTAAVSTAVFTFGMSGADCAPVTINGNYYDGTPLNASNTVVVQVNVTTAGTYAISTGAVNGVTFSASGTFAATGTQNVTLQGSGTPAAPGTFTLAPTDGATAGCRFNLVFGVAPGVITCVIDGVAKTFNANITASRVIVLAPSEKVETRGYETTTTTTEYLNINVTNNNGAVVAGNYSSGDPNVTLALDYTPNFFAFSSSDPIIIKVTTITATRFVGTFSGTVRNIIGQTKVITNGVFNVPF